MREGSVELGVEKAKALFEHTVSQEPSLLPAKKYRLPSLVWAATANIESTF